MCFKGLSDIEKNHSQIWKHVKHYACLSEKLFSMSKQPTRQSCSSMQIYPQDVMHSSGQSLKPSSTLSKRHSKIFNGQWDVSAQSTMDIQNTFKLACLHCGRSLSTAGICSYQFRKIAEIDFFEDARCKEPWGTISPSGNLRVGSARTSSQCWPALLPPCLPQRSKPVRASVRLLCCQQAPTPCCAGAGPPGGCGMAQAAGLRQGCVHSCALACFQGEAG